MRTVLICHAQDAFDRRGLASWLASFSELAGIVVLEETRAQKRRRYAREYRRVGALGMLDVVAMRVHQRLFRQADDQAWLRATLASMERRYGPPPQVPELRVASGNDPAVVAFLRELRPDIVLARCKQLLSKKVFSIARAGTLVMHPGICPEYRNAHGCFWALASGDLDRVGMTLLRIDRGVDTGPIFGYFHTAVDELAESHFVIQNRVVLDNLPQIADLLQRIDAGTAVPIQTAGRSSRAWGQPWLSSYLRWKHQARRRSRARQYATLS